MSEPLYCDICTKAIGSNRPCNCVTCVRNALEQPRLDLARILIEREDIGKHVEATAEGREGSGDQVPLKDSTGGFLLDPSQCAKNVLLQRATSEKSEIEERISLIADQAASLRAQIDIARKEIEERKKALAQRKSDFASATHNIEARRAGEAGKVQQSTGHKGYKWNKMYSETIETRVYLCTAAAQLAGLKMTKRRTRDGGMKEVFNIGPGTTLRIYDLRDLSNAEYDRLSASLAAVCQLLVRISHYLGVRLPAEITLPHNDYPQPTIFTPASSYSGHAVPFPGATPSHSSSNSPDQSRTFEKEKKITLPKPRTLYVDRRLSELAVQDPPAYAMFLEGVALLAFNVAWLCRTQGIRDDFNHWEDVCPMGRNLYRLLIQQETRMMPSKTENPLDKEIATPAKNGTKSQSARPTVGFGELSHSTAHSFLGQAENITALRGWKLNAAKITDHLKAFLLVEQQGQEWEVLHNKEWNDMEDAIAEEPVLVGTRRQGTGGIDDGRSVLTATTAGITDAPEKEKAKSKGVNGWTKVKSRSETTEK